MRALAAFFHPQPSPGDNPDVAAEIRAEIEHHLARSADDLAAQGLSGTAARAEALRRFGDPTRIEQDCLRIRTGGLTMLRRIHAGTTALLFLIVIYLFWNTRVAQAQAMEYAMLARDRAAAAATAAQDALRRESEPVEHIIIQIGDELELIDFANGGLGDSVEAVAADGKVLLPTIGWVHVGGLTREDAESVLTDAALVNYQMVDIKVKVRKP